MPRITLTREIVITARQRAWHGQPIGDIARTLGKPYKSIWQAVRGITWRDLHTPPPIFTDTTTLLTCCNPHCGAQYKSGGKGAAGRCATCYRYYHRCGFDRDPAAPRRKPTYRAAHGCSATRPCRHCGLQTDHESGQCVYCRQERRVSEAI